MRVRSPNALPSDARHPGHPQHEQYLERGRIACRKNYRLYPEEHRARSAKKRRRYIHRMTWKTYQYSARLKGLEFAIEQEEFLRLIVEPCVYCGQLPEPVNGLDRVDNSQGYIPSNVVTCCAFCNYAKRHRTTEAFLAWATKLYVFQKAKQN